jgi:FlaG/FlaF family flagellin (archaellin)
MTRFFLCITVILAAFLSVQLMECQEAAPPPKASATASESPVITNEALPKEARIYVAPIQNGFETYIVAGLEKKKVPVVVVADRSKADYEVTGVSDTDRAGWAKMLFLGSQQTNESASIKIVNLKTGNVVFAYSVNKTNSVRGKQSAGEAVAKHINEKIENRYH